MSIKTDYRIQQIVAYAMIPVLLIFIYYAYRKNANKNQPFWQNIETPTKGDFQNKNAKTKKQPFWQNKEAPTKEDFWNNT